MKSCAYCGRQNEDGQARCTGCGTDLLRKDYSADVDGVLDHAAPCRRCRCGGVMRYYRPSAKCSTFRRPFNYCYLCGDCGNEAVVTPPEQRWWLLPLFVIGCVAGVALYFSDPLDGIERSAFKTRWVVVGLILVVVGLVSGALAWRTSRNRHRYPIFDDPPETAGRFNTSDTRR